MHILGCRLDTIDAGAAADSILNFAKEKRGAQIVTLGTEMVVYAQRDPAYREVINNCALSLCDTIGLLAVARLRGAKIRRRVAGVELIEELCARAAVEGISIFLLGGSPGIAERAASRLRERHPGLRVAGTRDGYFPENDSARVAAQIKNSVAQLLFVGMGFPRQEFWLAQHLSETGCGAGMGVGGSFDVIGGNLKRAPRLWRRLGLEWFYRLISERRRWRRQLALPYFVLLVIGESIRR